MTAPPSPADEDPIRPPSGSDRQDQIPIAAPKATPLWIWLMVVALVLSAVGGLLFSRRKAAAPAPTTIALPLNETMVLGRQVYAHCIQCHQAHGRGIPRQFPPLAESEWVLGDPGRLVRIVHHGMMGPVRVLDQTYNGVMPGWPRMTDEELAAVLTYIRASWGNDAPPLSPAFVRSVRREAGHRARGWTAAELKQLPPSVSSPDRPAAEASPAKNADSAEGGDLDPL